MNTFITQPQSVTPKTLLPSHKRRMLLYSKSLCLFLFLTAGLLQSLVVKGESPTDLNPVMALATIGSWDQLSPSERQTLANGGTVQNFNLGVCDGSGQSILANISSGPVSVASDPNSVNARRPRRWGNTSFYLARQTGGGAGVEYCFELSTPTDFSMDSREHAYFTNTENITVTASNGGSPVNLTGGFPVMGDAFPAEVNGNGTSNINFNANGRYQGGVWWQVSSNGQAVTEICIQYYTLNPGELPSVEPFRLLLEGDKCVADSPITCDESGFISRWNRLNTTDRNRLNIGKPVYGFHTGFCDESGDPIRFVEINSSPASNAPFSGLNNREPRPYGEYSLDNGREYIGMGGSTYCFILDEARPIRVNSEEHSFFAGNELVKVSAFLGAIPVTLSGQGGNTTGPGEITFNGADYANGLFWQASSNNQPVSQICVEYVNFNGATLGREPFALEICADRCLFDDRYACSLNPASNCSGLPNLRLTKNINPINDYGLNTCLSPTGEIENAQLGIEITMENFSGTLKQLWLEEDLLSYFGPAYVDTVTAPQIIASDASGNPLIDPFFDGRNYTNIFQPGTGFLQAGQSITISFIVELDINAPGAFSSLINTAYGGGLGNGGFAANDLSGGLPAGDGFPTFVPNIPTGYTTVPANDLTLEATLPNYMNGIDAWLANHGGASFSVPNCHPVSWTNDYDESLPLGQQPNWQEGCGQITGSIEVSFMGTNACGHVFTTCATFTLEDTEGPSCTKPEDLVLDCDDPAAPGILQDWLDYVGGNWTDLSQPVTFTNDFTGLTPGACNGDSTVVTWTATDACGNESYFDANLTVVDNTDPILDGIPPNITVQLCDTLPDPPVVTATDGCDADVEIVFTETSTGTGCDQVVLREWTATDDCGNSVTESQEITVTDNIAPDLVGVPADISGLCINEVPAMDTVTAEDNCDTDVDISFSETQTGSGCNLIITRTWTATDDCGNSFSASQNISFSDTVAPTLANIPDDMNLGCVIDIPVPTNVTAMDNCDTSLVVDFAETSVGDDCNLTITRTWSVTDDCGNTGSASQVITIVDDEAPVFSDVPADTTVICPDIPAVQDPTVLDGCDLDVEVIYEEEIIGGPCPAPSQIIRSWIATDDCGNSSSVQQVVTVEAMASMITFTFVPADTTATCDENPMFGEPTAETTCATGGISITFEDEVISTGDCDQPFSVVRTWTAHDDCGNLEQVSQTLNIGPDAEAPIFDPTNLDTITVDCGAAPVFPIAFDNCGATNLSYEDSNQSGDCMTGFTFTRTWTATDLCGNTATFSQEITTNPDMSPPVFTFVPFDQFFDCDEDIIFPEPVAVDNCSGVTITFQDSIIGTGDCNEVNGVIYGYDIIRTWTATDDCGNSSTAVTSAWVIPGLNSGNQIAFLYMPADMMVACGEPMPFGEPICQSACGVVTLTFEDEFFTDCDNGHSVTRTWTAADDCGNSVQATQTITFELDNEGPVFTFVPAGGTYSCTSGATPVFGIPEAEDNCVSGLSVQITHLDTWQSLGGCDGESVTRTWTATDACGNESIASQTFIMTDDVPPVFTIVPADLTIACGETVNFGSVAASDNCSSVNVSFTDETIQICEGNYIVTRTWTASDLCGNQNTASQTITVEDTEAPVFITSVSDQVIQCGDPVVFTQVEAIDGCSSVHISYTDQETTGCESSMTRTWTATDGCGHSAQLSQTITVIDEEAPEFVGMPAQLSMSSADFANWTIPAGTANDCGAVDINIISSSTASCEAVLHSYQYTATDACGNQAQHLLTVSIYDAVFVAEMDMPGSFECGMLHDLTATTVHGTPPYSFNWELLSGDGWEIMSGNEESTASIMAGEGSAELSLSVTDANGCEYTEQVTVECGFVSAVNSLNVEAFSLSPNPTSGFLNIEFNSKVAAEGELRVLNSLGEIVVSNSYKVSNGFNQSRLDVAQLPSGTYILQLNLAGEMIAERFVKY